MPNAQVFIPVAKDIYQVRIPLPFALDTVNCYLLRGKAGWTIVDTGLNIPNAQVVWLNVFRQLDIKPGQVQQIVLTHAHPDHYGLAGWLQKHCQNKQTGEFPAVYMSPRESELVRQHWGADNAWKKGLLKFWRTCGVPVELAMSLTASTAQTRLRLQPHPQVVKTISHGKRIRMGDRYFQIVQMPGHSDGQLLFYDASDRLLICGDHILLKITSHIGLWPDGEPDPLGRYLASLDRLSRLDVRLALPGHGVLITDIHGRIDQLKRHHVERLKQALAAASPMTSPFEASQHMFAVNSLGVHELRFAVAETLAHLEFLFHRKRLHREEGGIWIYSSP